jgi:DNA mismatch repair protein MSH6
LEGKSTFYIEMEETKNIISNATINSLVIMDELGRGTSTHDGMIIAKTILDRIRSIKCRTLFTTHYHGLKEWCAVQNGIDLYFMDCSVNDESKDITFLYKFKKGVCPQSYGIHVAKLAGLPVIFLFYA